MRHGDPQPAGAHAQHHVVRGVVAVAAALAAEQSPDGLSAEDHPGGGRADALEPLLPVTDPRVGEPWGERPVLAAQGEPLSSPPRQRQAVSLPYSPAAHGAVRVPGCDAAGDWTKLSSPLTPQ